MLKKLLISFLIFLLYTNAYALLSLELTKGMPGAIPISIQPFEGQESSSQNISAIISNDLKNSGRFKIYDGYNKADTLVRGKVREITPNYYQVSFELEDTFKGNKGTGSGPLLTKQFSVTSAQLRPLAHHISDLIYQQMLGVKGVFSTRLAYIVVQRNEHPTRYILEVCDQDGYNPKVMLTSTDPIMSPAWSPNGKKIAYVSFENRHAAIYVQDVQTGGREKVSDFPGINGAPAWSPDGRKLALVLSKSGAPNIYTMDLATRHLTQLTNDFYINTEPAWSPDGRSIIFTSNRSGNPQIYQMNLATRGVNRITYDGNYNARASFTPDGSHIVVLNRESSLFNVGVLDLNTGTFQVLTHAGMDSESPSIAANGSMILYGTLFGGQSVLSMVATDGSVQVRLPARNGEVQDPAWSPFLG